MSPDLNQRVHKLFEEAINKPEGQRLAFLKAACTNDLETYQGVVRLLESLTTATSFLGQNTRPMERIGRYVLTGELGRGAMGVVYEAMDPLIGRSVAVKIIHLQLRPGSKEAEFMRDRLFREARAAGRLFHPGIVVILDVGQEGDTAFIAMERVDGSTLERMLASGPRLKIADSLDILRQAAAALDYAHENGVVHRDIKPANIMLHKGTAVKVADFGIAKSMSTEHGTMAGMILGTPSYMSPEQIEAQPVTGRSDQFSLAVVAYELLSGNRPFKGDSLATLAHLIVYGDRPSIRSIDPTLPPGLDEVLHRALAKRPELRYESCTQFVAALDQKLSQVGNVEGRNGNSDSVSASGTCGGGRAANHQEAPIQIAMVLGSRGRRADYPRSRAFLLPGRASSTSDAGGFRCEDPGSCARGHDTTSGEVAGVEPAPCASTRYPGSHYPGTGSACPCSANSSR